MNRIVNSACVRPSKPPSPGSSAVPALMLTWKKPLTMPFFEDLAASYVSLAVTMASIRSPVFEVDTLARWSSSGVSPSGPTPLRLLVVT